MSQVTNVLILLSSLEENMDDKVPSMNMVQEFLGPLRQLKRVDGNVAGGNKAMECIVYAGAFTGIISRELIGIVRKTAWVNPFAVQLLIKDDWDESFTMHRFGSCGSSDRIHPLDMD